MNHYTHKSIKQSDMNHYTHESNNQTDRGHYTHESNRHESFHTWIRQTWIITCM